MPPAPSPRAARQRRTAPLAPAAALALLATAACTSGAGGPEAGADGGRPPVAIEHAYGSTEITGEPERIVTLGWTSEATLLELGVVPVGMAASTFAGDDEGRLPWNSEKIEELGAEEPALLDTDDGVPAEEIAALEPDLILAVQTGIEEDEYEQLSAIAPTVAYLDEPWMTPWQEEALTVGRAIGREDDAQRVVDGVDDYLAGLAEAHPELQGATFATGRQEPGTGDFGFSVEGDARYELLEQVGLEPAPFIGDLEPEPGAFSARLSREHAERIDAEVLVMWAGSPEEREKLEQSEVFRKVDAVREGGYIGYDDTALTMAITSPGPLSIPWAMDEVVEDLSAAAEGRA
ncbi:iron-siderophore ABC transporter substrate-binding protein [Nocardiopsis potens]|uniref:iron-siderophore ABC transporter substrate-binding protein n=1 Tax=Nocardiopsis potens TaxID=1246458 RepID=UPI0003471684|nr:iron-siderophore ABC transporter substrate-binding protein [Nocardiopsis potens]